MKVFFWLRVDGHFGRFSESLKWRIRISFGPFTKEGAKSGQISEIDSKTISFIFLIWANPGHFFSVIYSFQYQIQFQFQHYKLKKRRCCARDMNPGPQYRRCIWNHRAMAAVLTWCSICYKLILFCSILIFDGITFPSLGFEPQMGP